MILHFLLNLSIFKHAIIYNNLVKQKNRYYWNILVWANFFDFFDFCTYWSILVWVKLFRWHTVQIKPWKFKWYQVASVVFFNLDPFFQFSNGYQVTSVGFFFQFGHFFPIYQCIPVYFSRFFFQFGPFFFNLAMDTRLLQ